MLCKSDKPSIIIIITWPLLMYVAISNVHGHVVVIAAAEAAHPPRPPRQTEAPHALLRKKCQTFYNTLFVYVCYMY